MTNETKILRYIAEHGSVSYHEMVAELWINSPRDVVTRMRKKGITLKEWTVKSKNGTPYKRFGL